MKRLLAIAAFTVFAMQSVSAVANEKPEIYELEPVAGYSCLRIVHEGKLLKETRKSKFYTYGVLVAEITMIGDRKVSCQTYKMKRQ